LTVDTDILRQLTIFLMTADPVYQERQLSLIRDWGSHVVVLDGSKKPQQDPGTQSRNNHRITYFQDKSLINRFRFAAEQKPTDYAMIMSDDDVFVKSGVAAALHQLRDYANMGSVTGPACRLAANPYQKNDFGLISCENRNHDYLSRRLSWSRDEPSPEMRILAHAFPYQTRLFYSASRGHVLQAVFRRLGQLPHRNRMFLATHFELLFEFLALREAPAKSTKHLFWLRSTERVIEMRDQSPDFIESDLDQFDWLRRSKIDGLEADYCRFLERNLDLTRGESHYIKAAIFDVFLLNEKFNPLFQIRASRRESLKRHIRDGVVGQSLNNSPIFSPLYRRALTPRWSNFWDPNKAISDFRAAGGTCNEQEIFGLLTNLRLWAEDRMQIKSRA
jgi:hypothetical protein